MVAVLQLPGMAAAEAMLESDARAAMTEKSTMLMECLETEARRDGV